MGSLETQYERNLRIAIADAVKKDREETLRLAESITDVSWLSPNITQDVMKMLKERAS